MTGMKLNFLKHRTNTLLRDNHTERSNVPYKKAQQIGIIFSVEDKVKHDNVKDLIKKFERDGKKVTVIEFLPENKDNYEFRFDFFTERDLSFWGNITSAGALKFADTPFDFLFYIDATPNPVERRLQMQDAPLLHPVNNVKSHRRPPGTRSTDTPFPGACPIRLHRNDLSYSSS